MLHRSSDASARRVITLERTNRHESIVDRDDEPEDRAQRDAKRRHDEVVSEVPEAHRPPEHAHRDAAGAEECGNREELKPETARALGAAAEDHLLQAVVLPHDEEEVREQHEESDHPCSSEAEADREDRDVDDDRGVLCAE